MTINQIVRPRLANRMDSRTATSRRWLTVPGIAGIGYTLSWIAGLSVPAPSPRFNATGAEVVATLTGHHAAAALQFALTEGLPAAGIAVISVLLARRAGAAHTTLAAVRAGRVALAAGAAAAVISLLQFIAGLALIATTAPGTAHLLYGAVNRMDGVKMLTLAVLGAAGAAATVLPRWLRYTGIALAVSITASGVVYLLLLPSLAVLAGAALVLLLVFITGAGLVLGKSPAGGDR
ncbi:MAG: hypothetical protein JO345_33585 [Streptosporangiaceae bacterium]|nr:hypothetical protein [Streptosporangiaceae bacterium]